MRAEHHVPLVFIDPTRFQRAAFAQEKAALEALGGAARPGRRRARYVLEVSRSAAQASEVVRAAWSKYKGKDNPDLRLLDLDKVAALIEADFPTQLYYVPLRNSLFDTHVNQASPHDRQLLYCSDAIAGFFQEMERIGRADDVVMYVYSEFGRRVPENTSLGTDHGTAQVNFVIGNAVKGGFYGTPPSLTDLVLGDNLENTTDFRQVYATLIDGWLGVDAAKVLGRRFDTTRRCSGPSGRGETTMATRIGWSPGPAAWKDDLTPLAAGRLERRPRRAPAGARRLRRDAGRDPGAGRRRPRPRRPLARALRGDPESADAAVRRVGAVGSVARPLPGEPAGGDRSRRRARHSMGVAVKPAGSRPVQPVSDRFFYWLRATMLETRRLGYWWANRMLQTTHPVEQKMALLWHGHFATHENKVRDYRKMAAADRRCSSAAPPATCAT